MSDGYIRKYKTYDQELKHSSAVLEYLKVDCSDNHELSSELDEIINTINTKVLGIERNPKRSNQAVDFVCSGVQVTAKSI